MGRLSAIVGELIRSGGAVLKTLVQEPRYFGYALLVHAGFLLVFVLSFEWTTNPIAARPEVNVVQAVAVDEAEVQKELDRLREAEARKKAEEEARLQRQREEARRAEQQRKEAEAARKREEQRLAEARRQTEEQRRLAEEERKREQRVAEEKRKAEEERVRQQQQLAELEKKEQELARQLAEKERQAEQQRLEAARQEEQRKRQEAERRRLEEQLAAERAQREQSEVERYVEIIRNQVERDWNKPANWPEGTKCTVRVNLIPGGAVTDVRVTKSCGGLPNLDKSVEDAVYRASPLSVPPADSGLFERFRELEFVFNPQG